MSGLYIHVPFCVRKCNYCDFCSVGIGDGDDVLTERMVDCIIKEMDSVLSVSHCCDETDAKDVADRFESIRDIDTVFIGGGTPSILPVKQMERLLSAVGRFAHKNGLDIKEFTIECNPGTVDEDKLSLYKSFGINRLSFGLQSANDDELKTLGRIHTYKEFLKSYELARSVGFDNINIDLMNAIPGQTKKSLNKTLDEIISLEPEHISAYSLIIEEGTPFYDKYVDGAPFDEDEDRSFFQLTHEKLTYAGFDHYEISNYAKKKSTNACIHNLNYWNRGNYIGIGPAAASHFNGIRKTNTREINKYMDYIESGTDTTEEKEILDREKQLIEVVYLGLRTSDGIVFDDLKRGFALDINNAFKNKILSMKNEGLADYDESRLWLTPSGWWVSDYLITELIELI